MSKNDDNEPTTFPKKYANVLKDMPEFKDKADAASEVELKKIIVEAEGNIYTIEKEKSEHVKLNACKDLIKDYSLPFNEGIKSQMTKIKYALFLLEGKGSNLDSREDD